MSSAVLARARAVVADPSRAHLAALAAAVANADSAAAKVFDPATQMMHGLTSCQLSNRRSRLFEALWRRVGHLVAIEALTAAMYADATDGGPLLAAVALRVTLYKLRLLIKEHGVPVRIVAVHGVGYRMDLLP